MVMRCALFAFTCLAACTAANPSYVANNGNPPGGVGGVGNGGAGGAGGSSAGGSGGIPGSGGSGGTTGNGGSGGGGGSGADDMAMAPPDLAHPGQCGPTERQCTSMPTPASEDCVNDTWTVDRRCPFASLALSGANCSGGYCRPPTGMGVAPCAGAGGGRDIICSEQGNGTRALSCQPFVTNPAKGTVEWVCAVAATYGRGSAGDQCATGDDCRTGFCASNGTCFVACLTDNDCPGQIGCGTAKITVEGVTLTTRSCTP
jgi:hypothetical protein